MRTAGAGTGGGLGKDMFAGATGSSEAAAAAGQPGTAWMARRMRDLWTGFAPLFSSSGMRWSSRMAAVACTKSSTLSSPTAVKAGPNVTPHPPPGSMPSRNVVMEEIAIVLAVSESVVLVFLLLLARL